MCFDVGCSGSHLPYSLEEEMEKIQCKVGGGRKDFIIIFME